jgi:hypothetical protein
MDAQSSDKAAGAVTHHAMLLRFRASNFRSLRDTQELSMVVPTWVPSEGRLTFGIPRRTDRVGTVAGIYGSNASGKSTVILALWEMKRAVMSSHQRWAPDGGAPHDPFLLDSEHGELPSVFEVEILLRGERWQYGFGLDRYGVDTEWLYSFPLSKRRVWFERSRDKGFYIGKSLVGQVATLQDLTRGNSLFLSVGAANNHPDLALVANWFSNGIRYCSGPDEGMRTRITTDELSHAERGPRIQGLLRLADMGIVGADQVSKPADPEARDRLTRVLAIFAPENEPVPPKFFDDMEREVTLLHRASAGAKPLALNAESRGTQAWFALLGPVVLALDEGCTLLVDEIDSSLHPHVVASLIRLFRAPSTNPNGAQLVFTTHDVSLLGGFAGDGRMHRDELWFTEKDESGATTLYPLTDYRPRKGENLERGYLSGRYGAIPVLDEAAVGWEAG